MQREQDGSVQRRVRDLRVRQRPPLPVRALLGLVEALAEPRRAGVPEPYVARPLQVHDEPPRAAGGGGQQRLEADAVVLEREPEQRSLALEKEPLDEASEGIGPSEPVSYTHLTLPTKA